MHLAPSSPYAFPDSPSAPDIVGFHACMLEILIKMRCAISTAIIARCEPPLTPGSLNSSDYVPWSASLHTSLPIRLFLTVLPSARDLRPLATCDSSACLSKEFC